MIWRSLLACVQQLLALGSLVLIFVGVGIVLALLYFVSDSLQLCLFIVFAEARGPSLCAELLNSTAQLLEFLARSATRRGGRSFF